jgi:hypothetical protein
MDFENLPLWQTAFDVPQDERKAADRLISAYRAFWDRAKILTNQIQKDLPFLTLHDESHFNALWRLADQIAGPDYKLTPLEAFVFGGAVLLHDAANTVVAFPGGIDEIRATPEWNDAFTEWKQGQLAQGAQPAETDTRTILLQALRALHAERAETLASFEVKVGDATFHLIEDDQLREHLGDLIGAIAASHHWDIEKLPLRLRERVGGLQGLPTSYTVRPILLACLLRCADAAQLDQQRTPDFLYGLLKLQGVSEAHWRAQNRLSPPFVDTEDKHSLVFTSTKPFGEQDAQAWWLAYEAIRLANGELRASNSLLRDLRFPPFAINQVRGAESPLRLAELVVAKGWRPVTAEIRVTRVRDVVEMFGGEQLYGHDLGVPLREMIQNAADAIRYRRQLEAPRSLYSGRIIVRLRKTEEGDGWVFTLTVEDDGLGMSEAVLTGPLIDFGSSYISSSLVKSERPGLLSKGRIRIGKFGIGFFSAFMLSDNVSVSSRPFDEGLESVRTLRFDDGLRTRPILLNARPIDFDSTVSTRVLLKVSQEHLQRMLILRKGIGDGRTVTLRQLVACTCPMLDCDVYVDELDGELVLAHRAQWYDDDAAAWLKEILALEADENSDKQIAAVERIAPFLRFIDNEDKAAGRAAMSWIGGLGVRCIGTLRGGHFGMSSDEYAGSIDFQTNDPRRVSGKIRRAERIPAWATEQAHLYSTAPLQPNEKHIIARRVAMFGGDATAVVFMTVDRVWRSISEIADMLINGETIYAPLQRESPTELDHILITSISLSQGLGIFEYIHPEELKFCVPTVEGGSASSESHLYRIPVEGADASTGFYALLEKLLRDKGYELDGSLEKQVKVAEYVGKPSERSGLVAGAPIHHDCLKMSCRRIERQPA